MGLLNIPIDEFLKIRMVQVYWKMKAWRDGQRIEDNRNRTICLYLAAPNWDEKKFGKLRSPEQLWRIEGIDSDKKDFKMSKVTKLKKGEKPFTNFYGSKSSETN
jgi:hypothetical protein